MLDLEKYFDPYERKARAYPALLILLPIIISISINYKELYTSLSGLVALAIGVGGLHLLTHVARDAGKKKEPRLHKNWGGLPSITIFRYSDSTIPKPAKKILHTKLAQLTNIPAPTIDDEKNTPEDVDDVYRSWSDYLRVNSRDTKKYGLLFQELINYGFRRNVFGMKYWYCLSGILALGLFSLSGVEINQVEFGVVLFIAAYSIYFALAVNTEWVKMPANEYAKRLIETIQ